MLSACCDWIAEFGLAVGARVAESAAPVACAPAKDERIETNAERVRYRIFWLVFIGRDRPGKPAWFEQFAPFTPTNLPGNQLSGKAGAEPGSQRPGAVRLFLALCKERNRRTCNKRRPDHKAARYRAPNPQIVFTGGNRGRRGRSSRPIGHKVLLEENGPRLPLEVAS